MQSIRDEVLPMTKVEELRAEYVRSHALDSEDDTLDALLQAVRDEEWGRAVASGYVEATACPRCSTEACSVCPADKTRYCP